METRNYIICFVITILLGACNTAHMQYIKAHFSKVYDWQKKADSILNLFAYLSASWAFMSHLADGEESGLGWWLLCFALGMVAVAIFKAVIERIFEKIWHIEKDTTITTIQLPHSVKIASHFITIILELALCAVFCYGTFTGKADSMSDYIIFGVCIALFLGGAYFNTQELRKLLRK